jgi:hypothetical protein
MDQYHKIHTLYLRDQATKYKTIIEGKFAKPEFEFLATNNWLFTEKIDGMNIRVIYDGETVDFRGKTDRAQVPGPLKERLTELFTVRQFQDQFQGTPVCFYGEGYGPKIQNGGKYRSDQDFILLDIKVGWWWLKREYMYELAKSFYIDVVPVIGRGNLYDMVELARKGFKSVFGDFTAEGIVAKPCVELRARNGSRLITKIKCQDFFVS